MSFYDENAKQYFEETVGLDVTENLEKFLTLIPVGGHILDLGCGSGRDSRYFIDRGYRVTAIDASRSMAELASAYIGQPVEVLRFQDIKTLNRYDGIWACASLLHCPTDEIRAVFSRIVMALKPGGIWYLSLKYGNGEGYDQFGRYFNYYTSGRLKDLIAEFIDLRTLDIWEETKVLRGVNQIWVNALIQKVSDG